MMDAIVDQFDAATPDEPNTLDIEIDVVFQRKPFTSLHLREPLAKEIERAERELNVASATPYHFRRYQMTLIAQVAKVPIEVVGELPNSQLRRAWDFLRRQLDADTPEIGEN
jgi:hypothetical protein